MSSTPSVLYTARRGSPRGAASDTKRCRAWTAPLRVRERGREASGDGVKAQHQRALVRGGEHSGLAAAEPFAVPAQHARPELASGRRGKGEGSRILPRQQLRRGGEHPPPRARG